MGDTNELSGLAKMEEDVLNEAFSEGSDNAGIESNTSEIVENIEATPEVTEEPVEAISEETELEPGETVVPDYVADYSYKFNDQVLQFDDRVKASIKSKEDEEYFRDLMTKSSAFDMYKEKNTQFETDLNEYKTKYSDIETKYSESQRTIDYVSGLMDRINNGDGKAFTDFLALCNVDNNALQNLGMAMAGVIQDPNQYQSNVNKMQADLSHQQMEHERNSFQAQQEDLAVQQTDFMVERSITESEYSNVAKFIDEKWGAGSFKTEVMNTGAALMEQNPNISFNDIPKIVEMVANKYSSFIPGDSAVNTPSVTKTQIVNNPTSTIPTIKSGNAPIKDNSWTGGGLDALEAHLLGKK